MEIFKEIKGYEGIYWISNYGKVKSKTKVLKNQKMSKGYLFVSLCKNGVIKQSSIHRLVALHFLKEDVNRNEVNHIDGNKLNNHVSNLEWCNRSENNSHAFRIGLRKPYKQMLGKFGINHNKSKECIQISKDGFIIGIYGSYAEATRETKIPTSSIHQAIKGKLKHAGGYLWQ